VRLTSPFSYLCTFYTTDAFPGIAEWKRAYPKAKMIGVEGLPEKKKAESWEFDRGEGINVHS
jgi:hypothetical protein